MQGEYEYGYVKSVFDPFSGSARVPESFGRPTAVWQHKYTGTLSSTVNKGHLVLFFNPTNVLAPTTLMTLLQYKDSSTTAVVDVEAPNISNWAGDVQIPAPDYTNKFSHARVVSAELRLHYYGREDEKSGMLFAAVISGGAKFASGDPSLISQLDDGHFTYSGNAQDGLSIKYLPWDRKLLEFSKVNTALDADIQQIGWLVVGVGLKTGTALFRYEMVLNMEGIVVPAFSEYINVDRNITDLGEETLKVVNKISHIYPALVSSSLNSNIHIDQVLADEGRRRVEVRKRSSNALPGFK